MRADVDRINDAVRSCLNHCYKTESPLAGMAEFCRGLRVLPGWEDDEIRAVETIALRILNSVIGSRRTGSHDQHSGGHDDQSRRPARMSAALRNGRGHVDAQAT